MIPLPVSPARIWSLASAQEPLNSALLRCQLTLRPALRNPPFSRLPLKGKRLKVPPARRQGVVGEAGGRSPHASRGAGFQARYGLAWFQAPGEGVASRRPSAAWASGPRLGGLNPADTAPPLRRTNRRGRLLRAFGRGVTSGRPASPTRWRPPTQRLRNPEVRSHGGAAGEAGRLGRGGPEQRAGWPGTGGARRPRSR